MIRYYTPWICSNDNYRCKYLKQFLSGQGNFPRMHQGLPQKKGIRDSRMPFLYVLFFRND